MKVAIALVSGALAVILAGCDIFYGVDRVAPIKERPDLSCVDAAIRGTPGIKDVRYRHHEGGTTLTFKSPASISDSYIYQGAEGSHINGVLQILWEHQGNLQITDHLMEINSKPPQQDIDSTRPVMKQIEDRLESMCGMVGLTRSMKESCTGVECK